MFYHAPSNQYLRVGIPFEIDGTQYPANWLQLSSPEEKEELGLQDVVVVGERKDDRYFWVSESLEGATLTITSTPKDLEQMRSNAKAQIRSAAYSMLLPSDWMVTRKMERGVDVPVEWTEYRAAVVEMASIASDAYDAATSVDEILAVEVTWPTSPDAVVPVVAVEE